MPKASDLKPSNLFSLQSGWPWRDADEPRQGVPARIVGVWTDTVRHQPGEKPQRGFGGRLIFYGRDEKEPILVDGQLVVYAFDETHRELTDNKPTRRYVFPAEQLTMHMSKNELGPTYSFWLPWDEAGGPKTEVSLICRFEPKRGAVITSEQTKHLLPGAMLPTAVATTEPPRLPDGVPHKPAPLTLEGVQRQRQQDAGTRLAHYEAPASGSSGGGAAGAETPLLDGNRRMNVTSITLPKDFQPRAGTLTIPATRQPTGLTSPSSTSSITPQPAATAPAATQSAPQTVAPQSGGNHLHRTQLMWPQLMSAQPMNAQPAAEPQQTQIQAPGARSVTVQPALQP